MLMISSEEVRHMTNSIRPRQNLTSCVLLFLLIIGQMTAVNWTQAEEASPDIRLKVKEAWLAKLEKREPVWVQIENIDKWAQEPKHDLSKFVLCMGGICFKNFTPTLLGKDDWLGFQTDSSSEFRNMWQACVSRSADKTDRQQVITVLYNNVKIDGYAMKSIAPDRDLLMKFLLVIAVTVISFGILAYKSDIIREPGEAPTYVKRYSLGRTQMAWWFFVVVFSYLFIWRLTGDLNVFTTSVLGLLGISAGTALGSAVVDSGKRNEQEKSLRALESQAKKNQVQKVGLESEVRSLAEELKEAPPQGVLEHERAARVSKQKDVAIKEEEIRQLIPQIDELKTKTQPSPSQGFLTDVLSDDKGISFHRFQMFAWTIVLTFIFIKEVYDGLSMPDFDATLLGLMGLSGGTYIGFKLPSQQG